MNVSLRPLEDQDLDTIYQQVTDPESIRMAAFTAEDQTDRPAFLTRMARLRADTSVSYRVIDVDGAIAGTIASFRIDNQPELTYWVDRTQWGKGIASAALQILLAENAERPLYARAASDNVGSLRVLEKAGFRRVGVIVRTVSWSLRSIGIRTDPARGSLIFWNNSIAQSWPNRPNVGAASMSGQGLRLRTPQA